MCSLAFATGLKVGALECIDYTYN